MTAKLATELLPDVTAQVVGSGDDRGNGARPARQEESRATNREYDAADDLRGSLLDCYGAVKDRVAAGGKGWP